MILTLGGKHMMKLTPYIIPTSPEIHHHSGAVRLINVDEIIYNNTMLMNQCVFVIFAYLKSIQVFDVSLIEFLQLQ